MKKSFSPSRAAASLSAQPRKPAQQSPRARLASAQPRAAPARPASERRAFFSRASCRRRATS